MALLSMCADREEEKGNTEHGNFLCVLTAYCYEDIVCFPLCRAWKTNWSDKGSHFYPSSVFDFIMACKANHLVFSVLV